MSAPADARVMPPIAVHWVKNNIVAAVISAVASLCIYGVRQATGAADAEAGLAGIVILYAAAVILWAFSGSADGLLTGAVLQRVVPLLPAKTWIGLNAAMTVVVGAGNELALLVGSGDAAPPDDGSIGQLLAAALIAGAAIGAVVGGLQALVLRRAALGTGAWIACSSAAFAIVLCVFTIAGRIWDTGGGIAGELANQAVAVLAAVIIALVMLPALRGLRSPILSASAQHFT
jgi:hypothetical protein